MVMDTKNYRIALLCFVPHHHFTERKKLGVGLGCKKAMYIYTKLGENGDGHKKHTRKRVCFLCAREDLHLHVLTDTRPSSVPVY
jgi:hypothetical protein